MNGKKIAYASLFTFQKGPLFSSSQFFASFRKCMQEKGHMHDLIREYLDTTKDSPIREATNQCCQLFHEFRKILKTSEDCDFIFYSESFGNPHLDVLSKVGNTFFISISSFYVFFGRIWVNLRKNHGKQRSNLDFFFLVPMSFLVCSWMG